MAGQYREYDVLILGGGSLGSATAYMVSEFTGAKRIGHLEKEGGIGLVASNRETNSQTRHPFGGEDNYDLERMRKVKKASDMIPDYLDSTYGRGYDLLRTGLGMALAVGDEIPYLARRFEDTIKPVFPDAEFMEDKREIEKLEPYIVRGRPEDEGMAVAKLSADTVDFGGLAKSFVDNASKHGDRYRLWLNKKVNGIEETADGYRVTTSDGSEFSTRFLVISAGSYTLSLAKKIGLGKDYVVFPIDGKFFVTSKPEPYINGKVYTVQEVGVPFANVHADRDWEGFTRYGPTASFTTKFEKGKPDTEEFVNNLDPVLLDVMRSDKPINRAIRATIIKNTIYSMPIVGRRLFWKNEARKIVPSLKYEDLLPAPKLGGVRAVAVNRKTGDVKLGEMTLHEEDVNVVGNISPSPGASGCLYRGYENMKAVVRSLDLDFYSDRLEEVFGTKLTEG